MDRIIMAWGVVALLALSSCSTQDKPAPTPTKTQAVTQSPTPTPTETEKSRTGKGTLTDEEFGAFIRDARPYFDKAPTEVLVANADSACSAFDHGATFAEVTATMAKGAPTEDGRKSMAFLLETGVRIYCPEYASKLEGPAA